MTGGNPRGGFKTVSQVFVYCGLVAVFLWLTVPAHAASTVVINEIMWDEAEYIELYNPTTAAVNLSGWSLTRQQANSEPKLIVTFATEDTVPAGGYYLLEKNEDASTVPANKLLSTVTLVNMGELLTLKDGEGQIVDTASQLGAWLAGANTGVGAAMEREDAGVAGTLAENWHTALTEQSGRIGTPAATNSVPPINEAPEVNMASETEAAVNEVVIFSAEDTTDDGGDLIYGWSFGDGSTGSGIEVNHTFKKVGNYVVTLTVSDGALQSEISRTVKVTAPVYATTLVINEFLANPTGSDTATEFIELKNIGSAAVDITGWQLDDAADSGSSPYTIPSGASISASGLKVFYRADTKLALNNDRDTVRLLDPSGAIKTSYAYDAVVAEGLSHNRSGSGYALSTSTTPGAENVITEPEDEDEDEDEEEESVATATGRVAGTSVTHVVLADVREEEKGTLIQTEGIVSAPPGVVGSKVLYLYGSGIQVYFSKAEFPDLKLGDKVQITGELSSAQDEARLKLASSADIKKIAGGPPPAPHQVATGEIDEEHEGSLVVIQGHVTQTSGDTFYVDDESGEVKVFIAKTAKIDKPKMKKGDAVTITGVVSQTKSGYRILPRFQEDVRLGLVAGLTSFPATGQRFWLLLELSTAAMFLLIGAYFRREPLLFLR